jgi:zinc D-Ala-D-Ala carboxypeptidase
LNVQLTKNFSLGEFLRSQTASRHGIPMDPPRQVVVNLTRLCCLVLQPLRAHFGAPIVITSGYRPPALNQAIGSSSASQHVLGLAADFAIPGVSVSQVFDEVRALRLPYDQLINEFGSWSMSRPIRLRGQREGSGCWRSGKTGRFCTKRPDKSLE